MNRWLAGILLLLGSTVLTYAHDVGKARTATEEAVFSFYATWYRPPERAFSCCDMKDCRVVEIKLEKARWFFMDNVYQHAWRDIPDDRIESNTRDPRESPDGNSHVCFNAMYVLCAVLGSGQ